MKEIKRRRTEARGEKRRLLTHSQGEKGGFVWGAFCCGASLLKEGLLGWFSFFETQTVIASSLAER